MTRREEFRAYMKAVSRTSDNSGERHLTEAEIFAYCRGEIAESDRESVRAHLIDCEQCIALFRDARDFRDPARQEEEEKSTDETNHAWQSLLQRIQSETGPGVTNTTVVTGDFQRSRATKVVSSATLAMAATLLISFSLLGWQTWRLWHEQQSRRQLLELGAKSENNRRNLEQRLAELEQTNADQIKREHDERVAAEAERDQLLAQLETSRQASPYVPLYSFRLSSERGTDDELRLRVARAATAARVRLIVTKPYEYPRYSIELVDSSGKSVQKVSGVRPVGDEGALSFTVKRATLSDGKYRLRLYGVQGNTQKQLGDYALSVKVDH